jgi:hypothetical protein
VLHLGWTNITGLLFVNLYFYIFNQQRFRAGPSMNSSPAASPARYRQFKTNSEIINHHFSDTYGFFAILLRTKKERQNFSGF